LNKSDDKEKQREIYQEERGKLTQLPDADADFIALERASDRYYDNY
jgi:hypothetical protein